MIEYKNIYLASEYYSNLGYDIIDAPWIVSQKAYYATKPEGYRDYETLDGYLVASGEQSFIQLMIDNKLKIGKSCCITPCFRDESILNDITKKYFIKLELIVFQDFQESDLLKAIDHSFNFFSKILNNTSNLSIQKTDIGYDIFFKKIELGSYGIRTYNKYSWIYATGCAEPRLSFCLL